MKILSILLRAYFFIAGAAGVASAFLLFGKKIDWSLTVGLSMLVTLFIGFAYLFFAWRFNEILPTRKHLVQGTIFITLCNTLATMLLGILGQNQVKIWRELNLEQLTLSTVVAVIGYSILIFLVGKVAKHKTTASTIP